MRRFLTTISPVGRALLRCLLLGLAFSWHLPAHAALSHYDAAISADTAAGLVPLAKLTNALTFNDVNKSAFNFGNNSGDVTMEFVLQGDPAAGGPDGYLAVGANANSSLRYEQWNNTGQLGFTQLGVADYLFSPVVPSPTVPVHVAYIWKSAARTMELYLNGSLAGARSGVDGGFAMPTGQGWLGNNAVGSEGMAGIIHRVTIYDAIILPGTIQRHADAFNGTVHPPILVSFTANPAAINTPNSAVLSWSVTDATAVFIDGTNVTAMPNYEVSPEVTKTYSLVATNAGGSIMGNVTVLVNPAPVINSFTANKLFVEIGETATLTWNVLYGENYSIVPGPGDVAVKTVNGTGSVDLRVSATTTYTLNAGSVFGSTTAHVTVAAVQPAAHPVISEFMADNESTLPDEDGEFPDWIEIYNPTISPVSLLGYFLTDDKNDLTRWAFPEITLAPGAYQIVFASGKSRVIPASPLHASFQLDKAGEYLALIGPGLAVTHEFAPLFPPQNNNISFGLLGGDVSLGRFMGVPTPGAANDATPPPLPPVQFSRASGTFTDSFFLALTTATPGAEIRFTFDGSTPNATNGTLYITPIWISSTKRIRAAALAGGQASTISSSSYIKLAADLAGYASTLPILIIENFGAGVIPQKGWSGNGSGIKQVPRQNAAWATFDRQAGLSAITNAPQMFSDIGIRGRGAFSSSWRQKPYSVEAMDADGGELNVSPLGMPPHADWTLYFPDPDSNKDPSLLFNTFAYELSRNFGDYSVRFRWVEAFINEDGGELRLADRRGVYAIIEKVSRGKDRLHFQQLSADGTKGGWLLNLNRMDPQPETGWPAPNGATQPWYFHTAGPNRIQQTPRNAPVVGDDEPQQSNGYLNFDNPNGYTINPNQRAAIENWFKEFEDVLWNNALWRDPVNGYRKYLDDRDFADYFILNVLTRNGDGLLISMFPWKGDDGRLRMGPAWDYNWSAYYISGANATGSLLHRSDRLWYKRLFADPDFKQLYIDRWWELRRGPMSNAAIDAIIDGQAADISPAKAMLNGFATASAWAGQITQMKTWLKTRANWIDGSYLRPPSCNQNGGTVANGFQVVINGTNGTVSFTTDGSDPRARGGAVAASAQTYQVPITLTSQTLVQARVRNGTNWSGLAAATFYLPQDLTKLAVTEIMFNPPASGAVSGDEVEFLELKNMGTNTLALGTLAFTEGINLTFTNGTWLTPGQFFMLARNENAFKSRYPNVTVNGIFTGKLDNGGETLRLSTPAGNEVLTLTYNDGAPWPAGADGTGLSLQRPALSEFGGNPANWVAAWPTPGADLTLLVDSDSDHIPDVWETPARRLNPNDPSDALADFDDDSMNNLQEYLAGTDPNDAASLLKIERVSTADFAGTTLMFDAMSNRTYSVQFKNSLDAVAWLSLTNVPARATNRVEAVTDSGTTGGSRFYRLATP
jgi:hypothetical protein